MKKVFLAALLSVAAAGSGATETELMSPEAARVAVGPSLRDMGDAANAHDVDRHVGFYAHDASVILVFDGLKIVGWDSIHEKQREWWKDGKTDVLYTMIGKPDYMVAGPGLVITTLLVRSRRTVPSGEVKEGQFAVSDVWQKRREGWRVIYSHESTTH